MATPSRLLLRVTDHEDRERRDASARARKEGELPWTTLAYSPPDRAFVFDAGQPGRVEVRVEGPAGWRPHDLAIDVHAGDHRAHATIAPFEEPFYVAADGVRVFFKAEPAKFELACDDISARALLNGWPWNTSGAALANALGKLDRTGPFTIDLDDGVADAVREVLADRDPAHRPAVRVTSEIRRPSGSSSFVSAEVVVALRPGVTSEQRATLFEQYRLDPLREIPYVAGGWLVEARLRPGPDIAALTNSLCGEPAVRYAEPNVAHALEHHHRPTDFLYDQQPELRHIGAEAIWEQTRGQPDIVVAIVDSSRVDDTHPDLAGRCVANPDFAKLWASAGDESDHATQCASAAVGAHDGRGTVGVAGECGWIGVRLPSRPTSLQIADAWVWAAGLATGDDRLPAPPTPGAAVISNSWGRKGEPMDQVIKDALAHVTTYGRGGRGCVVCFSTGNECVEDFAVPYTYAASERVLAVGASVGPAADGSCSCDEVPGGLGSSRAATTDTRACYSPYGPFDLVAPSHTCHGDPRVNPIMAATRSGRGAQLGDPSTVARLTQSPTVLPASGASVARWRLALNTVSGFKSRHIAMFEKAGARAFRQIDAVDPKTSTITVATVDGMQLANGDVVRAGRPDYSQSFGGTSYATALVAGAAALVISLDPELTWIAVREILRRSAKKIDRDRDHPRARYLPSADDPLGHSQWYGHGRLDLAGALAEVGRYQKPDVFIRDNLDDDGSEPSQGPLTDSPDLWVRRTPGGEAPPFDRAPPHERPRRGEPCDVFVRVTNRGKGVARTLYVRLLLCHAPGFEPRYPEHWRPAPLESSALGPTPGLGSTCLLDERRLDDLAAGESRIVKLSWEPRQQPPVHALDAIGTLVAWRPCLLADVTPHDGRPQRGVRTATDDNNLARREIAFDDEPGDRPLAVEVGTLHDRGLASIHLDGKRADRRARFFVGSSDDDLLDRWRHALRRRGARGVAGTYRGRDVIYLDRGAPLVLPARLAAGRFTSIYVGALGPTRRRDEIRIAQNLASGAVSRALRLRGWRSG